MKASLFWVGLTECLTVLFRNYSLCHTVEAVTLESFMPGAQSRAAARKHEPLQQPLFVSTGHILVCVVFVVVLRVRVVTPMPSAMLCVDLTLLCVLVVACRSRCRCRC